MKKYTRLILVPVMAAAVIAGGNIPVSDGTNGIIGTTVEAVDVKLSAPTGVKGTSNTTSITLTWNLVGNSYGYNVYVYNNNKKVFQKYATVDGLSCTIKDLKPGKKYYFLVSAIDKKGGEGARSKRVAVTTKKSSVPVTVGKHQYLGEIANGLPNGQGKILYSNGNWYEGGFKDGLRNGDGILYNASKKQWYVGHFTNDKANGNGVYYYSNGDWYEGTIAYDKLDQGTYHFADGEEWTGRWKNGTWIGGKKADSEIDGLKYNPEAYNYNPNIKALTFDKNETYIGIVDHIGTTPDVKGRYYFSSGDWYMGEWKKGIREGQGMYFYANGDRYIGEFKSNKMNGLGTIYYSDGRKYEGEWMNGRASGQGTMYLETGEKWVGTFKNNKFVSGVKYKMDGTSTNS